MGDDRSPYPRDETDDDRKRLDDLAARLRTARKESEPVARQATRLSGAQVGYRVGIEMLAGVIGGAGVGWLLDRLFGSAPWLMVVLLFMGFAAGVLNAYRAGKRAAAQAEDTNSTS
jgi:ATP synthase protein I